MESTPQILSRVRPAESPALSVFSRRCTKGPGPGASLSFFRFGKSGPRTAYLQGDRANSKRFLQRALSVRVRCGIARLFFRASSKSRVPSPVRQSLDKNATPPPWPKVDRCAAHGPYIGTPDGKSPDPDSRAEPALPPRNFLSKPRQIPGYPMLRATSLAQSSFRCPTFSKSTASAHRYVEPISELFWLSWNFRLLSLTIANGLVLRLGWTCQFLHPRFQLGPHLRSFYCIKSVLSWCMEGQRCKPQEQLLVRWFGHRQFSR